MEDKKFRMPPIGCIFWSLFFIVGGCVALYMNLFEGWHGFKQGKEAIVEGAFVFLGGLMFYRGMQGKEYRFWHKDWKTLDEEKAEKEKDSQN